MGSFCSRTHIVHASTTSVSPGTSRNTSKASNSNCSRDKKERLGRNHDSISLPNGKKKTCIIQLTSAIITPQDLLRIQCPVKDKYVVILTVCATIPGSRKSSLILENPIINWGRLRLQRQVPEEVSLISGQGTTHIFAILADNSPRNADIVMSMIFQNGKVALSSTISSNYLATLDDIQEFAYTLQKEKRKNKAMKKIGKWSTDTGYSSILSDESNKRAQSIQRKMNSVDESYCEEYGFETEEFREVTPKKEKKQLKRQGTGFSMNLERVVDVSDSDEDHETKTTKSSRRRKSSSSAPDSTISKINNSFSDDNLFGRTPSSISCAISQDLGWVSDNSRRKFSRESEDKDSCRRPNNPTPGSGISAGSSVGAISNQQCQPQCSPVKTKQRRPTPFSTKPDVLQNRKVYGRLSQKKDSQKKYSFGSRSCRDIPLIEEGNDVNDTSTNVYSNQHDGKNATECKSEDGKAKCSFQFGRKNEAENTKCNCESRRKSATEKEKGKNKRLQRSCSEILEKEIVVKTVETMVVRSCGCFKHDDPASVNNLIPGVCDCKHKRKMHSLTSTSLQTIRKTTFRKTKSMPVIII